MANNEAIPLLIGTSNPAKSIRLANCFSSELFRFVFPESISEGNIPEETADTHESIAAEKAKYWSSKGNGFAVSSDGGLKIPILKDNWNSVFTHRFAGPNATDQDRINALLGFMSNYSGDERSAYWEESVALGYKGVLFKLWAVKSGMGRIALEQSGTKIDGFWAANIWVFPDIGKPYTELTENELNDIGDPWVDIKTSIDLWVNTEGWDQISIALRQ